MINKFKEIKEGLKKCSAHNKERIDDIRYYSFYAKDLWGTQISKKKRLKL